MASARSGIVPESSETPSKPENYVIVSSSSGEAYRMVKPYHFDFSCSVRQRWFGQNIIDIFSREFPARDRSYYLQALADGRLRVEGCEVTAETPLRDGQRMRHFIHRHEPPVPAGPIQVVGQSTDAVAVCKPHGMPVHVAGQYRKNTVHGILTAERPDLGPLYPVHRLDKPVSGLLLFARSPAAASALCAQIESRGVEKVYVARVLGRFPEAPPGQQFVVADVPLDWDPVANLASAVPEAAAAVEAADAADAAVAPAGAGGAAACSAAPAAAEAGREVAGGRQLAAVRRAFRELLCVAPGLTRPHVKPRTGRTHQIRVHLQWLGHPIANDAQYGGTYGGPVASRQLALQMGVHWSNKGEGGDGGSVKGGTAGGSQGAAAAAAFRSEPQYRLPPELCDGLCIHCPFYAPKDYPLDLRPLWLHARSYSCVDGSWSFSAELPQWAHADWVPPPPAQ
ncbi:hypothetical protein COHA_004902 [Chlorella ohadii]|uniref:Pseudouridine synthase RsuA/RluA-like domain-containing protein n=1 Tax=Chlorella ohadii TaxID=2649997 RepID=A0AAD5DPB8_9CHLO|nr:hypothetical protein COHA_004902 [Chlorella ohadii]